jgi:hypothetical protein
MGLPIMRAGPLISVQCLAIDGKTDPGLKPPDDRPNNPINGASRIDGKMRDNGRR